MLDKKKIQVSYFFMGNPYIKFQNPSIFQTWHAQKKRDEQFLRYFADKIKKPKITKGHNSRSMFQNLFKS